MGGFLHTKFKEVLA